MYYVARLYSLPDDTILIFLSQNFKWILIRPLDNFLMNLTIKITLSGKKRSRSTGPDFVQMLPLQTMSLRTIKH